MWNKEESRIIGFAGCGQQELISGTALLFEKLNKKILLMDFTDFGELRNLIPLNRDFEKAKNIVLKYREVDYIYADAGTEMEDYIFDYDIILADFGRNITHEEIKKCSQVYYVTDMCNHNILQLKEIIKKEEAHLVLKNYLKEKGDADYVAEELNFSCDNFYVLPYEEGEAMQFMSEAKLENLKYANFTRETKGLLSDIVRDGEEEGAYKTAVKAIEKRRKVRW
ncbi:MAG: hypothetical protein RR056_05270 [Acetivibrio sp.]